MEGSQSEAIFDSLKLNPQLFVNEVLNRLDDSFDGAFDFFHQEASTLLKIEGEEGTDRANDLAKGVAYLRDTIRSTLERPLELWEKYCLRHVFAVPQGFSLPTVNESSSDIPIDIDAVDDTELDAQLDSLRDKLALGGSLNKALQLHDEYFDGETFKELKRTAKGLRAKVGNLNTRRVEETECITLERMRISNGDMFRMYLPNGLSKATLEELQQFITDIKGA